MHLPRAEQSYGFLYCRYYFCYSPLRHRGAFQIDMGQTWEKTAVAAFIQLVAAFSSIWILETLPPPTVRTWPMDSLLWMELYYLNTG
ncbi:uncharacterized [Tachysurus ichikawai]